MAEWKSSRAAKTFFFFYMELDCSDGRQSGIFEMDSAIAACLETEPESLLCSDCSMMLQREKETDRECRSAIDLF